MSVASGVGSMHLCLRYCFCMVAELYNKFFDSLFIHATILSICTHDSIQASFVSGGNLLNQEIMERECERKCQNRISSHPVGWDLKDCCGMASQDKSESDLLSWDAEPRCSRCFHDEDRRGGIQ